MPRGARKLSSSGIYHIVLRAINKQVIFKDKEDNLILLDRLQTYQKTSGYQIYAYCLMNNHFHLLMKEGVESLGTAFKRIGASYVYWYNWKYSRVGHLFQDRYRSEAVEKDDYFLTVLRYIHQNPIKAGIVKKIQDYPWSSYLEYMEKPVFCNTEFALKLFSSNPRTAQQQLIKFHQDPNDDQCLEYDDGTRLNDTEATELIKKLAKVTSPSEILSFDKKHRDFAVKQMRDNGLSIRQIERLTGVSIAVIRSVRDKRYFDG